MTQDKKSGGNSLDFTYPTANSNGKSSANSDQAANTVPTQPQASAPQAKVNPKPQAQTVSNNDNKSVSNSQSQPAVAPQAKVNPKPQAQTDSNNDNKSVSNSQSQPAVKNPQQDKSETVQELLDLEALKNADVKKSNQEVSNRKGKHAPGVNGNGNGSDSLNSLLDKLKKYKENLYKDQNQKSDEKQEVQSSEPMDLVNANNQKTIEKTAEVKQDSTEEKMGDQLTQSSDGIEEAAAAIEKDTTTSSSISTNPTVNSTVSNANQVNDKNINTAQTNSAEQPVKSTKPDEYSRTAPVQNQQNEPELTEPVLTDPVKSTSSSTTNAAVKNHEMSEPVQESQPDNQPPASTKEVDAANEQTPALQEQPQVLSYGDSEQEEDLVSEANEDSNLTAQAQPERVSSSGQPKYTIYQLLDIVKERDASDLHISVGYPVHIRVDGELVDVNDIEVDETYAEELILPLLDEAKRDRLEVNREVDLAYAYNDVARFRVNAFYQRKTMAAALRLIPNKIRSIEELGLPQVYYNLANLNQGLVLVTGPTGSGKSTTLASIIQEVNKTRASHIITIEDPIEYVYPEGKALVAQRELGDDTHSWKIALRSALREDPDVVLVGEMRDYETIASAITLAETGHLVFATLHTNSAAQTVDRIIDVFPEHQQNQVRSQLSNILEAVIAQRLVPLQGGGRKAVSEIMLANPAVRNLIREGKTHQLDNVIRTSADIGMISMEHSLVKLVRSGEIDMETAQRFAVKPEEVVRLLKN